MLSVRPEMAASCPERVRELLGYSIHPPFMVHADGRHPAKQLDPAFSDATAGRRSGEFWEERTVMGDRPDQSPER